MAPMTERDRRRVAAWLFLCAALAFAVVLVGGVTRLTRSGLSITEWQPLIGALPPLSQAHWEALFAAYRDTPEFRLVNFDMTLEGFKTIFWWEYIHRLLARTIGLVHGQVGPGRRSESEPAAPHRTPRPRARDFLGRALAGHEAGFQQTRTF